MDNGKLWNCAFFKALTHSLISHYLYRGLPPLQVLALPTSLLNILPLSSILPTLLNSDLDLAYEFQMNKARIILKICLSTWLASVWSNIQIPIFKTKIFRSIVPAHDISVKSNYVFPALSIPKYQFWKLNFLSIFLIYLPLSYMTWTFAQDLVPSQ